MNSKWISYEVGVLAALHVGNMYLRDGGTEISSGWLGLMGHEVMRQQNINRDTASEVLQCLRQNILGLPPQACILTPSLMKVLILIWLHTRKFQKLIQEKGEFTFWLYLSEASHYLVVQNQSPYKPKTRNAWARAVESMDRESKTELLLWWICADG